MYKLLTLAAAAALVTLPMDGEARSKYHGGHHGHHGHHGGYYDRRCRNDGTGGAIIGGVAGGLLGNAIAGHGDKTLGTVLGAGGGALAGNAIARNGSHRC